MHPATLPDTWHELDHPVLCDVVRRFDEDAWRVETRDVAESTGLPEADVRQAFRRLVRGGLLTEPPLHSRQNGWQYDDVAGFAPEALTLTGRWPTPELAFDRMVAALEAIATTDDEDTRTRARKLLDGLTGAGKQVGLSVAAAAITGQIPS